MKALFLTAAATALAVVWAAPASAQQQSPEIASECLQELQAFGQEVGHAGYGVGGPAGYGQLGPEGWRHMGMQPEAPGAAAPPFIATPRGELRILANAAHILALNGREEGCETVLSEMREVYDQRRDEMEAAEPMTQDEFADWRSRWLAASISVGERDTHWRLDEIIGADIRNPRDEQLGTVDDVLLSPDGDIEYVLVEHGAFLGIGGDTVAVPWRSLRVTMEPERHTFVLMVSEEAMENAPQVDDRAAVFDEAQRQRVDEYWQQHLEG